MKRTYLTVCAVVLFLMGAILALAPRQYAAGLGFGIGDPHPLNVVRSFGGFYLGFVAYLMVALSRKGLTESAVLGTVLAMVGLLAGRTASLIVDGASDPRDWVSMAVELSLAIWGAILLRRAAR